MGDISPDRRSGCGLLSAMFGRRSIWPNRRTNTNTTTTANTSCSLPPSSPHNSGVPITPNSKKRRGSSGCPDESNFLDSTDNTTPKEGGDRIIARPAQNHRPKTPPLYQNPPANQPRRASSEETTTARNAPAQSYGHAGGRKVPQGTFGISGELESMISDHQRSKGSGAFVRASSGNVMLYGNLGNLRQPGGTTAGNSIREEPKYPNNNVVKKKPQAPKNDREPEANSTSLCRALSTRMDPEQLKIMGNEDYKNGRFAEALALYDAAISIDPNKASYRSNKSAALTALGRLLEAVFECREAIRIEPFYQRAHNRLATLYVRLGEAENAMYHYKQAGSEAEPEDMAKAKNLHVQLSKCTDAKKQRDWNTLIKATSLAISAGADSAPQIFALKSEALLRLQRHQEADEVLTNGPNFNVDDCTKFFGPIGNASVLVVRALVEMAAGRFDNAVAAAETATRLDSNNKEASVTARRTRAVGIARSKGNELFKGARYSEACRSYGEGLEHDPKNSVLLCNRAACLSKLGQYQKAIDDCNAALCLRPSYSKARLRRADCNSKLENWKATIQDLEVLIKESPENEEVSRSLKEAHEQLKEQRGGGGSDGGSGFRGHHHHHGGVVVVSSMERFIDYVTSPGVSVVYFYKKPGDTQMLQHLDQLHNRNQSVNFLKVEVEEQRGLAKSEGVSTVPALRIYKDGSKAKEIPVDNNEDLLKTSIDYFLS